MSERVVSCLGVMVAAAGLFGCAAAPALRSPQTSPSLVSAQTASVEPVHQPGGADASAPLGRRVQAAFALGGDDVLAVGASGLFARYDGALWHTLGTQQTSSLRGVFATGPDDAWIVGDDGALMHGAPSRMQPVAAPRVHLYAVAGASRSDVWIAGAGGHLFHFDGASLSSVPTGVTEDLRAIAVTGPDDVRVVGAGGVSLHFDGTSWKRERTGTSAELRAIWARSPSDVWAVGDARMHWDGRTWTSWPGQTGLVDVTGDAESVWTLAESGAVARWNGSGWAPAGRTDGVAPQGVWVARAGNASLVALGSTLVH